MSGSSDAAGKGGEVSSYAVRVCRGVRDGSCRFALSDDHDLAALAEQTITESGWDVFVRANIRGPLRHHHAFTVAVTACPNGCSRPHVADVGFIRACVPELDPARCSMCRVCEKVCPEQAISMNETGPQFARPSCVKCGLCVTKCKPGALSCAESGYRIVLGGKLGRHPRLASELPGLYRAAACAEVLAEILRFYMQYYEPGLRLGSLVESRFSECLQRLGLFEDGVDPHGVGADEVG